MLNFSFRARSVVQISTLLGVCALAAVETSSAGGTTTVYKLVAQCTDGDCEGTGVGYLTVQNYIPGQPLAYANFVSFTYASNIKPYSLGYYAFHPVLFQLVRSHRDHADHAHHRRPGSGYLGLERIQFDISYVLRPRRVLVRPVLMIVQAITGRRQYMGFRDSSTHPPPPPPPSPR